MQPLADQLRPQELSDIIGQKHLLGKDGLITKTLIKKISLSLILWGPPGCGKTTMAHCYAKALGLESISLSAVSSGIKDLKAVVEQEEKNPLFKKRRMLFVDEVHRYNKAQQDFLLPYIEKGSFVFVGATTENPSFSLNNALLSRVRVVTLKSLSVAELHQLVDRYEGREKAVNFSKKVREYLVDLAQGDGRYLLNLIETLQGETLLDDLEEVANLLQRRKALFDRNGDGHYQHISALHKSVRGSDPQAALYWLARMLEGGEDPLFIARRLVRIATEDVGLSDPEALKITLAAKQAYEFLGSPEGELALAEAVVYLALAPKSNAIYTAFKNFKEKAKKSSHLPPPKTIINAPTDLLKEEGWGQGYQYDHDSPNRCSGQNYFPEGLTRDEFYQPVDLGFERELKKRLQYFDRFRK